MRAHWLQHVPYEGLGSIASWLHKVGYEITCTPFYESSKLPQAEEIDFLVIMGGPMSVNDENIHPWLIREKQFVKRVVESGKPTLGICLGAQLIANALGGKVFPNTAKEIGWYPIYSVAQSSDKMFRFPDQIDVFHWHGETFDLPAEAVRIAENQECKNQAFQIGSNVIGLQFHLETTPDSALAIISNSMNELVNGKYIQSKDEILFVPAERYQTINSLMFNVLEYLNKNNVNRS